MTSRYTLALVIGAGFATACGGSSDADLFSGAGGNGGSSGVNVGGSAGQATGGDGGSAGSGNAGSGTAGSGGVGNAGSGGVGNASSGGVGNAGSGGVGNAAGVGNAGSGGTAGSGGVGNAGSGGVGNAGSGGVGNAGSGGIHTGGAAGTGGSATGGTGGVVRGTPGVVICNQKDCHVDQGNWCCDPWYRTADPVCIARDKDCDNDPNRDAKTDIVCDGPEDCPTGNQCCGSLVQFTGGARRYDDIVCKTSCAYNDVVVCGDFPEQCGPGQKCEGSGLLESGYKVCVD